MTSKLKQALKQMSDTDFRELEQAIQISRLLRYIMKDFNLDKKEVCQRLQIQPAELKSWLTASHGFTIRDISKIQTLREEKLVKQAIEEADQTIQFPPYKYSKEESSKTELALVDKLQDANDMIEKLNQNISKYKNIFSKASENWYSKEIFQGISDEEFNSLCEFLKEKGIAIDRLGAFYGRKFQEIILAGFPTALTG